MQPQDLCFHFRIHLPSCFDVAEPLGRRLGFTFPGVEARHGTGNLATSRQSTLDQTCGDRIEFITIVAGCGNLND